LHFAKGKYAFLLENVTADMYSYCIFDDETRKEVRRKNVKFAGVLAMKHYINKTQKILLEMQ
jgi:hypothetical protein